MRLIYKTALILAVCLLANSVNAQEQDNKTKKQTKKEERARIEQETIDMVTSAIDSSAYVLEADRLQNKRGFTINVPSNLNFIAVHGESAFLQVGSNAGIGPNGVGGVSVDTRITKMEVKKNAKTGSYSIRMTCMSSAGIYDVTISSNADGQSATATISGNRGGKLTYLGKLVPLALSRVFKGTPRF